MELGDPIGQGRFGTVHRGNWHGDVAIRLLNMDQIGDEKVLESFKLEVSIRELTDAVKLNKAKQMTTPVFFFPNYFTVTSALFLIMRIMMLARGASNCDCTTVSQSTCSKERPVHQFRPTFPFLSLLIVLTKYVISNTFFHIIMQVDSGIGATSPGLHDMSLEVTSSTQPNDGKHSLLQFALYNLRQSPEK